MDNAGLWKALSDIQDVLVSGWYKVWIITVRLHYCLKPLSFHSCSCSKALKGGIVCRNGVFDYL